MAEILEILKGRVLACLDSVAVLQVMVEHRVLLLKRWAHMLCDYVRAEDLAHEAMEELEDDTSVQQMARLVGAGVVFATECAVMVFLTNRCPNQVSHHFLCFSLCPWSTPVE